jgi:hypothetical protein
VLRALPSGLDPLYGRMMAGVLAGCEDGGVLQECYSGYYPHVPADAAQGARCSCWSSQNQSNDEQTVGDLVSRCGSFLSAREGIVSFIHLSAKDYFTVGNGKQSIDGAPAEDHRRLTERLQERMSSKL